MTGWRKGSQPFVPRQQLFAATVLACVWFAPSVSFSAPRTIHEDLVSLEFSALGKRGEAIVRAREQVIPLR